MPAKREGETTFGLRAVRRVGHAGAPCSGYYSLEEYTARDSTAQINSPSWHALIKRALGGHPEFGSEFKVTVSIKVTKRGKKSKVRCHNPWPAHWCKNRKRKATK